ncbi:MAG TPA: hypothetical protein VGG84_02510 [Gemmatimonadaceae bacterium]
MRRATAAIAGLVLLAAGACRRDPAGDTPYAREVSEAVPRIEKESGLKFKRPPKVEVRSRDEVRSYLIKKFDESTPQQELAGEEAAFKLLGLIPDSMSLRNFLIAVLTEQVIGYYDPATKVLYVVQGADEKTVGITLTHELVHALQDQYVDLDSLSKASSDNDRLSAAQAVVEGEAQFLQLSIMLGGADNIALRVGGRDRIREMIRENQSAMPVFATAPMVIQESLLFPYLSGADFVQRYKEKHGSVATLFSRLPTSTEQILHTDAYFGNPPDEPSTVALPAPHGARKVFENDLGEFGTRLFLYQHLRDETTAARAASGWAGDRYVVVEGPGGRGIVWATAWDTPLRAAGFSDALTRATIKRTAAAERTVQGGGAVFASKGRTISVLPRSVGNRALVVYSDLPDAMGAGVVNPGAITVTTR